MILKRFCLLLLIGLCSYLGYYLFSQYYWKKDIQIAPNLEKPLFTAENVSSSSYSNEGIRSYKLNSIHLEYYEKLDETHFNEPILWTYKNGIAQEWQVSSNFAVLKGDNILNMIGQVKILNLLPDAQIKTVNTERLTLNLTTQDFWSETDTDILGVGFQSNGKRVKGNFGSHQMELIEQVNSKYEPKTK